MTPDTPAPTAVFAGLPDLARADMGGQALLCSDQFFAGMANLLTPGEPVWDADRYTDLGKWMDGWEPRRRRAPGHDWVIIQLGVPGDLVGVDIDTRYFLGNHAPYGQIEAIAAPPKASATWLRDAADWTVVLPQTPLDRGGHNVFAVTPFAGATHVRLRIYPAGGVARLRVHGHPRPAPVPAGGARVDLASARRGGRALACSDMFFSRMDNLLLPTPPAHMGEGWETKRSALPRTDWVALALAEPGLLDELVIDTAFFKGNYPTGARVEGVYWPGAQPHALTGCDAWRPLAPDAPLGPDAKHRVAVTDPGPWTHLRITLLSDGGIARFKAFGVPTAATPAADDPWLTALNALDAEAATAAFARCCGATRWAARMAAARPFASREHLYGEAEGVWWHLGDGDWREAFTHHPRIGADVAALREKFAPTADWSAGEQAGVAEADEATLAALVTGNQAYEAHFGHIFIVCASGLTAAEMLARLTARLPNAPEFELRVAAGEQAKITRLRLDKLEL